MTGDQAPRSFDYSIAFTLMTKYSVSPKHLVGNGEGILSLMTRYATGVFYHPSFSRRSYLTVGARLADFPDGAGRDPAG